MNDTISEHPLPPPQPVLIPIFSNDPESEIPEWAMIEVNGEFLPPPPRKEDEDCEEKDDPADDDDATAGHTRPRPLVFDPDSVELGSVHFADHGQVR